MRQKRAAGMGGGEKTIRDIRRATRRQYSAEEKIRIVLDGLRGEDSIAELCGRAPAQTGSMGYRTFTCSSVAKKHTETWSSRRGYGGSTSLVGVQ